MNKTWWKKKGVEREKGGNEEKKKKRIRGRNTHAHTHTQRIDLSFNLNDSYNGVTFYSTDEQARNRFQSELEFVQCLANPNYLNFLAQRGYLRDKVFVNYLKYLIYWKEPEYAKFLKYPHSLHMLE